jgi:hypothetical protein
MLEEGHYLLSSGCALSPRTGLDDLRTALGVSDIECVVHDFYSLIVDDFGKPRELGDEDKLEAYSGFVELCERIAAKSTSSEQNSLIQMENWIMDYILIPLLLCSTMKPVQDRARGVYLRICECVASFGTLAREVPGYVCVLQEFDCWETNHQVGRLFLQKLRCLADQL